MGRLQKTRLIVRLVEDWDQDELIYYAQERERERLEHLSDADLDDEFYNLFQGVEEE